MFACGNARVGGRVGWKIVLTWFQGEKCFNRAPNIPKTPNPESVRDPQPVHCLNFIPGTGKTSSPNFKCFSKLQSQPKELINKILNETTVLLDNYDVYAVVTLDTGSKDQFYQAMQVHELLLKSRFSGFSND